VSVYRVEIARRAIKSSAKLPRNEQLRIRAAIDLLSDAPRPPGCGSATVETSTALTESH
jgi:mRNA-degrading endonuclease RelE of RelBE toxin-antitoxin system